jgi:hypothetical protein
MKELVQHPSAKDFMARLKEKADNALAAALPYTGILGDKQIREFLDTRPKRFTIDCGSDIIKGDIIRFMELVTNNQRKPAKVIGRRGITAEVIAVNPPDNNPILLLRVVASGGTWDIEAGTDIRRTMKSIIQMDIKRAAWDDEGKRLALKNAKTVLKGADGKPQILQSATSMLGRYDSLRSE